MAISLTEIMTVLQNGVQAIRDVATSLNNTFLDSTVLSSFATTGSLTFGSSAPETFLQVITSSGAVYKVPLYLP